MNLMLRLFLDSFFSQMQKIMGWMLLIVRVKVKRFIKFNFVLNQFSSICNAFSIIFHLPGSDKLIAKIREDHYLALKKYNQGYFFWGIKILFPIISVGFSAILKFGNIEPQFNEIISSSVLYLHSIICYFVWFETKLTKKCWLYFSEKNLDYIMFFDFYWSFFNIFFFGSLYKITHTPIYLLIGYSMVLSLFGKLILMMYFNVLTEICLKKGKFLRYRNIMTQEWFLMKFKNIIRNWSGEKYKEQIIPEPDLTFKLLYISAAVIVILMLYATLDYLASYTKMWCDTSLTLPAQCVKYVFTVIGLL